MVDAGGGSATNGTRGSSIGILPTEVTGEIAEVPLMARFVPEGALNSTKFGSVRV